LKKIIKISYSKKIQKKISSIDLAALVLKSEQKANLDSKFLIVNVINFYSIKKILY
jgi:hypothetical protein